MGITGQFPSGAKPEEEITVTAGTSAITQTATSGKTIKKVTVNPTPTEIKTVTPSSSSNIDVRASEGKHLSSVFVNRITGVHGVTIDGAEYSGNSLNLQGVCLGWNNLALPYKFSRGCAVVLNNEIHILGGNNTGNETNGTKHYKWNGSSWSLVSTLPYNFVDGSAVVFENEIHILGGFNASTKHYKWNGASWTSVSTLTRAFYQGSAVVLNGKLYILGGVEGGATSVNLYNGASGWQYFSTIPFSFYDGNAVVLNNEVHVFATTSGVKNHYKWDGSSWTYLLDIPCYAYRGDAVVLNGEVHFFGGGNYGDITNFSHYKLASGASWVAENATPYQFYNGCAVVLNNEIHLLGGDNDAATRHCINEKTYRKVG